MADATTVIQIDWTTAAAIATPIGAAVAAFGRFGWNALFAYLARRDETHINAVNNVALEVAVSAKNISDLALTVKQSDLQNRIDTRSVHERLINALTQNTQATETLTELSKNGGT